MSHASKITSFTGKYEFLSNFAPHSVDYEGLTYPTSEHAFQAAKTVDPVERERIRNLPSPGQAKRVGRQIKLRSDWDGMRIDVMRSILRAKFSSGLQDKLLETGEAELVEGNDWGDGFWGKVNDVGENWLGKVLMEVRAEHRAKREDE